MFDEDTTCGKPRAGIDPIDTPFTAQLFINELIDIPLRYETLAVLLDDAHRGQTVVSVPNTTDRDSVFVVADLIIERSHAGFDFGPVIIASVRPGEHDHLDDLDRWVELSLQLDDAGIELIEWFVIGNGVSCPRALVGEPPRWAA